MTNTTMITPEAVEAAKAIAKVGPIVWREAVHIGRCLAAIDVDDQKAREGFWKALAAEMTYGPHKTYWSDHNSNGRNSATVWAQAFVVCQRVGLDTSLMFSAGTVPTMASVKALIGGRDSVDVKALTASLTGKGAKPFGIVTVKAAMPTIKRGVKTTTKAAKGDAESVTAGKAIVAAAKVEAADIRHQAANDTKAHTLASIVDFIARNGDAVTVKAVRVACDQAASRLATADAT